MKIKREQLKEIIKECLVELLQEGLGNSFFPGVTTESRGPRNRDLEPMPNSLMANRRSNNNAVDPAAIRRRTMDLIEQRPQPSSVIHESQKQRQAAVTQVVANATSNPLMSAIFADTAQTTFAAQNSPGAHVGGDSATKAIAESDPVNMFGEDKVDAWNRAAFAPAKPGLLNSQFALNHFKGE
jgi:hypothetical protein